jgi:uncharacterized protein YtpQ (UPF0354 family)
LEEDMNRFRLPRLTFAEALMCTALIAYAQCAFADGSAAAPVLSNGISTSSTNLMVVLRETVGANKTGETLTPSGVLKGSLPNGTPVELRWAWFDFLGDMHIRFVFDSPSIMRDLRTEEFEALKLSPEEAVTLAVTNIERVYGKPTAAVWSGAVMRVHGRSPDFNSSYFLDREFWLEQAKDHPEGLVVAVPNRVGLLFTAAANTQDVERLRTKGGDLFAASGKMRVSSALYLFKDGHWSVLQAALPGAPPSR